MLFAEFYQKSAISDDIIPACGDRSVIILDGRYNMVDNAAISRQECQKRGYKGFTLNKGETFTRSSVIRQIERV